MARPRRVLVPSLFCVLLCLFLSQGLAEKNVIEANEVTDSEKSEDVSESSKRTHRGNKPSKHQLIPGFGAPFGGGGGGHFDGHFGGGGGGHFDGHYGGGGGGHFDGHYGGGHEHYWGADGDHTA